jgi:hypothetical protein
MNTRHPGGDAGARLASPASPVPISDVDAQLRELLARRILILDGAMGTMIQRYQLDEAAFRGERLADHSVDVRGNNDLLSLTRPDDAARRRPRDPRGLPRGRRRLDRKEYLRRDVDRTGGLRARPSRL